MMEVVQQLMQGLDIDEQQAEGGLGLILGLLQDKMADSDFSAVRDALPDADALIGKAPATESAGSGLLGGVMSMVGGGGLGNLAQLANGFSGLGMDSGLVARFIPVLLSALGGSGGAGLADKVSSILQGE